MTYSTRIDTYSYYYYILLLILYEDDDIICNVWYYLMIPLLLWYVVYDSDWNDDTVSDNIQYNVKK